MKLKINQLKALHTSLSKLDGYDRVISVEGKQKSVWTPYDLSGKTRWNLAKNFRIVDGKMQDFNKVRDGLIVQISGGNTFIKKEEEDKIAEFVKQMAAILETEEEVEGLLTVSAAELKLDSDVDVNPFPTDIILGLAPILK